MRKTTKNLITTNETFLTMTKATKIDQQIGKKIAIYRKLRNKTQFWLAEKVKISYQQIQNYERGKNRVAASRLLEISKILKTPIINFFPNNKDESL